MLSTARLIKEINNKAEPTMENATSTLLSADLAIKKTATALHDAATELNNIVPIMTNAVQAMNDSKQERDHLLQLLGEYREASIGAMAYIDKLKQKNTDLKNQLRNLKSSNTQLNKNENEIQDSTSLTSPPKLK